MLTPRVSSDADVSDDEEDEQDNNSCDSFIDDRMNPTAASTPAESCRIDMMGIYRFSLSLSLSAQSRSCEFKSQKYGVFTFKNFICKETNGYKQASIVDLICSS